VKLGVKTLQGTYEKVPFIDFGGAKEGISEFDKIDIADVSEIGLLFLLLLGHAPPDFTAHGAEEDVAAREFAVCWIAS
jgi:hypothetical protein